MILAAIVVVFLLSGCTRLSRIEADAYPGAHYLDTTSGVRLRVGERVTIDLMGGSRTEMQTFESRPVIQWGGRLGMGRGASLYGRVDYVPPHDVAGLLGVEIEW